MEALSIPQRLWVLLSTWIGRVIERMMTFLLSGGVIFGDDMSVRVLTGALFGSEALIK